MYNLQKYKSISNILNTLVFLAGVSHSSAAHSSVDHKNLELSSYLTQISNNQAEKSDIIVRIIKKYRHGTYLDIGSGRDTVPHIMNNLPKSDMEDVKLIAADLESKTLSAIAKMNPLFMYPEDNSNIKLSLEKMDATEMNKISDSSVKAINASAILHEVNSYVSSKSSIDRFFLESIRILEKNGFLIYRDPTLQTDPDLINSLVLKGDFAKKFVSLFLPKFLDNRLTQIADMYGKSIKPNFNYLDNLIIKLSLVDDDKSVKLSFSEFFSLPTNMIDFSKNITINAPRRLLSEIQRHYILFVKNVYPMEFLEKDKIIVGGRIEAITPKLAMNTVVTYATSLGIDSKGKMNKADITKLRLEESKIDAVISDGVYIKNQNIAIVQSVGKLLKTHSISTDLYKISKNNIWIDVKLLPILYSRFPDLFDSESLPVESMKWLKREGEEFYFYYTTNQLVDYLEKFCTYYLKGTDKEGYVLRPESTSSIKYIDRSLYKETLNKEMIQLDKDGKKQEFITSKTIIIFQLKPYDKTKVQLTLH